MITWVTLLLLIIAIIFILGPAIFSPGIRFIIIIFIFLFLWRLFKEEWEMNEGASLLLALLITWFIWKEFALATMFLIGILIVTSVVGRGLKG